MDLIYLPIHPSIHPSICICIGICICLCLSIYFCSFRASPLRAVNHTSGHNRRYGLAWSAIPLVSLLKPMNTRFKHVCLPTGLVVRLREPKVQRKSKEKMFDRALDGPRAGPLPRQGSTSHAVRGTVPLAHDA